MRKNYCKIVFLFFAICLLGGISQAQETRIITEDYKVNKEQCKPYIYELSDYLISKGLYKDLVHKEDRKGSLDWVKRKLTLGGVCFVKDYDFVIEIMGFGQFDEELLNFGEFGIIELGFNSKEKTDEVFKRAQQASSKYTINIFPYVPPFRCVQAGNSVLIVYSLNVYYDRYRNMAENWRPGLE